MMNPVHRIASNDASASRGRVRIDFTKVIWTGGMITAAMLLVSFHTNWAAVCVGLILTYLTLLLGHSVGMHRMMIHRSFTAKPSLSRGLIYLGTLVGIGGPSAVIKIHDTRDWAQRAKNCHDYFSHRRGYWRDISWQLFYKFDFDASPIVTVEPKISNDPFIKHLDQFWRWHQFGLGVILFIIGGLPFVVWGVFIRVAISTIGHWTITYICHNPGPGHWDVIPAGVQASNLNLPSWISGWLTHGECWHNNHHAFPESARIGLYAGQIDPAGWIIEKLEKIDWVSGVGIPREAISDLRRRAPLPKSGKL